MKTRHFLLISYFLSQILYCNGQIIKSRLDVVAGISAREYAHAGLRYQYSDFTQLGFYIGSDLELKPNEHITTFCIDHQIHFGELSFYSNRPVWYNRLGYTLLKNEIGDFKLNKFSYFNMAIGREIAFNDRLGINLDGGIILQFRRNQVKPKTETPFDTRLSLFPLARFQLFYSF